MVTNAEFRGSLEKLIELHEKQNELLAELVRLTHMADAAGLTLKECKGKKLSISYRNWTPLYNKPWKRDRIDIKVDGEVVKTVTPIEVHPSLWHEEVRAEWEREQRRIARRNERLAQRVTQE